MATTATENIVYTKITGYVELYDEAGTSTAKRLPLSSVRTVFALNVFPSAQFTIPTGKQVDGTEVIRFKELKEELRPFRYVEIWLQLEGQFAPNTEWPTEPFKMFAGYVTASSLTRGVGGAAVFVEAVHWLADLDASIALTSDLATGSDVVITIPGQATEAGSQNTPLVTTPSDTNLLEIGSDFWNKALKQKLIAVCKTATIDTEILCASKIRKTNDTALKRLELAEGDAGFDRSDKIDITTISFKQPITGILQDSTIKTIRMMLYDGSMSQISLWAKLLQITSVFGLTVIPTIESATVAPIVNVLAGEDPPRHVTIKASEYFNFSPGTNAYRMRRGVILRGQNDSPSGVMPDGAYTAVRYISPGCYFADNDEDLPQEMRDIAARGVIETVSPPPWLTGRSVLSALAARNVEKTFSQFNYVMRDVTEGDESTELVGPESPEETLKEELDKAQTFGGAYAKWQYWMRHYSANIGSLTGKLRFDIAPGSIIRIEGIDGKLYEDTEEKDYTFACVTSVQCEINLDNRQAATSFSLSHLRRNEDRTVGVNSHPLYNEVWVGTVLQNLEMTGDDTTFVPTVGNHEASA